MVRTAQYFARGNQALSNRSLALLIALGALCGTAVGVLSRGPLAALPVAHAETAELSQKEPVASPRPKLPAPVGHKRAPGDAASKTSPADATTCAHACCRSHKPAPFSTKSSKRPKAAPGRPGAGPAIPSPTAKGAHRTRLVS